jgi:hypothetical protein
MPHYKDNTHDQMTMIPASFARRILSNGLDSSLPHLIDREHDHFTFENHYCKADNGRLARNSRLLLKISSLVHCKGIISSRKSERLHRGNVIYLDTISRKSFL